MALIGLFDDATKLIFIHHGTIPRFFWWKCLGEVRPLETLMLGIFVQIRLIQIIFPNGGEKW